ncbi:autotransporter domain-containing protein [Marinobacter salexigens]|uniref:Autotransporter domain-containing protein n=1 Tax=Marinobacter salexigens TaxID=1925763 RepID=A0ABS6A9C7_9GAMM|nr:autotransporter domain-containing protein [Marinobacter salexigens]MBU2874562.1 autotransporter domain-containing protein [Marinobacter salexigens]
MENPIKIVIGALLLFLTSPFAFSATAVNDFYSINMQSSTTLFFYPSDNDTFDSGFNGFTSASFELIKGQGDINISPNGPTFEPNPGYSGVAEIRYTITDSTSTSEAFVFIAVENTNANFQAIDDTFDVPENADATPLDVRLNDQPVHDIIPSPVLSIDNATTSNGGAVAILTFEDRPSIYYTPPANFSGTDSFTYTLTRGNDTSVASVTVNVGEAPVSFEAVDDTFDIQKNADTVTLNVRENDQLAGVNGVVEVVDSISEAAEGGVVAIQSESSISYTPPTDFIGTDTFTYTLRGENGFSEAVVTVNVSEESGQDELEMPSNLTEEEARVFAVVIDACGQDYEVLPCGEIASMSPDQQKQLIQQVSGRHTKLQSRIMRQMLQLQTSNISSRLREIRDQRNQLSIDDLNLAIMGESTPLAQALQGNLRGGAAGDGELVSPWGAFVNGNISIGKSKDTSTRPSYDQDGYGLTFGLDYRFSDTVVLGAAAGVSKSDTDFTSMQGHQDAQSISLISFGNYYPVDNLYVDGFAMWTEGDMDINRRVDVAMVQQDLASDTKSRQLTAATSVGYEFNYQSWQSTVYGRLQYSDLDIEGYTETGGSMALTVKEQNTNSFTSAMGARINHTFSWNRGVIIPSIDLEYVKENNKKYNISNNFANAATAGNFSISADESDTEYMSLGTSLTAVFGGGQSAFIRYERLLLQDRYDFSSYALGLRMEF